MGTKISAQTNGRIRTTLPKALREETEFHDLENQQVQYRILCDSDGGGGQKIDLEIRFGPGIDPGGPRTTSPLVFGSTGQVQLEFPLFMASAWRLVDCTVEWDDGTIDTDDDGTRTVTAPIDGWEPPTAVEFHEIDWTTTESAVVTRSGGDVENTYAMLPTDHVRQIGLESGGSPRLEATFTCFQRRPMVVLEPTETSREQASNSRAVTFAGPNNSQPRIAAGEIVAELGLDERVQALEHGESVRLQWVVHDGALFGFVGGDSEHADGTGGE